MQIAIVDVDNTLWHFCDIFHEKLKSLNSGVPTPDHWSDWNFWQAFCSKEEFYRAINEIHADQDNDRHLPYPEAGDFLRALRGEGYYIIIASHRHPMHTEPTRRWLRRHGLVYDELHLSFDKTCLFNEQTSLVVDDSPQVLVRAVGAGILSAGLLFPWNKASAEGGLRLFDDLSEIQKYVFR